MSSQTPCQEISLMQILVSKSVSEEAEFMYDDQINKISSGERKGQRTNPSSTLLLRLLFLMLRDFNEPTAPFPGREIRSGIEG